MNIFILTVIQLLCKVKVTTQQVTVMRPEGITTSVQPRSALWDIFQVIVLFLRFATLMFCFTLMSILPNNLKKKLATNMWTQWSTKQLKRPMFPQWLVETKTELKEEWILDLQNRYGGYLCSLHCYAVSYTVAGMCLLKNVTTQQGDKETMWGAQAACVSCFHSGDTIKQVDKRFCYLPLFSNTHQGKLFSPQTFSSSQPITTVNETM